MNEAVDKVRKDENKRLRSQDINTLTGTKYLWLKNRSNFTKKNKKEFKILSQNQLAVGRAWNRKELLKHLWITSMKGRLESSLRNGISRQPTQDSSQ